MSEPRGPRFIEQSLLAGLLAVNGAAGVHAFVGQGSGGDHQGKLYEKLDAIHQTLEQTQITVAEMRATSVQQVAETQRRLERLETLREKYGKY